LAVQTTKEKSTIGYKAALVVLVIIIIAIVALPMMGFADNKTKAENNAKALFTVVTGGPVDVLKTTEEHGLYRITLRMKNAQGQDIVQDVYVTKDGTFSAGNLVDLEVQKSALTNQSSFANCLYNKNVRILGLSTDQGTQLQLQVLGAFSGKLYIDCGGQNLALCQQMNITNVPVIFVANQIVPGPQPESWFEQNLGCYMTENATKA